MNTVIQTVGKADKLLIRQTAMTGMCCYSNLKLALAVVVYAYPAKLLKIGC